MNVMPYKLIITADLSALSLIEMEQLNRCMTQGFSIVVSSLDKPLKIGPVRVEMYMADQE